MVILTVLNLTVTEGTINGLIFYANVLHANAAIFFPPLPDTPLLKVLASIPQVFIAWLDLDMGIEMCFYDGLDAYTKTWMQFAFPIYIWLIAGVIILLSRKYTIVARATGRHAVQVLATLFLLSFAKLQNTIIASISFTILSCDPQVFVWLPDGNIQYLQGKHIALFVAAAVTVLSFSIPYTFVLFFIQWLQRLNIRLVSRLKPVIDAYTGPYKDNYRFWTGHLLVVRVILFAVAATSYYSPLPNLLVILTMCLHLLLLNVWVFRGVYRKNSLDILESSFILNLAVLTAVTLYYRSTTHLFSTPSRISQYTVYILVAIALISFLGIVAFHIYRQIKLHRHLVTGLCRKCHEQNLQVEQEPLIHSDESTVTTDSDGGEDNYMPTPAAMMRFDQYREPLLGLEDSS